MDNSNITPIADEPEMSLRQCIMEQDKASGFALIPEPTEYRGETGRFLIDPYTAIVLDTACDDSCLRYAHILEDEILECVGVRVGIEKGSRERRNTIRLILSDVSSYACCDTDKSAASKEQVDPEAYILTVREEGITISAAGAAGVLYGVQTLRQLLRQLGGRIPCMTVEDKPRLSIRGFFHDATRGRVGLLDYYKKLADRAAFYKLNMLQLYVEHTYMFRDLTEVWRDDTPLTAEDILELDEYCAGLNIELVPALATFGHLDKVLKTKSYAPVCELEGSDREEFSFVGRMQHHTVNVTDPRSWELVKGMLDEYIPLFRSKYFNLCGDETFDLGKGRSREQAEKVGRHRLYVDFINRICAYLAEHGRKPMMWGDIIVGAPELISELPKDVTLLTWGYSDHEHYHNSQVVAEAGATQCMCPGVHGWLRFVNRIAPAYENISRMVDYAREYHGIGLINTDWGDYGHVSDPEFSIPGMLIGADGAWRGELSELENELRRISIVEYGDKSGMLCRLLDNISEQEGFSWAHICQYEEFTRTAKTVEEKREFVSGMNIEAPLTKARNLRILPEELLGMSMKLRPEARDRMQSYLLSMKGQELFNLVAVRIFYDELGMEIYDKRSPEDYENEIPTASELASELERWYVMYADEWRRKSRESELYRVRDVICRYADMLREL